MAYIDTKYIGQCETCRHYYEKLKKCKGGMFFCDSGESYSPNMFKIPTADVVEVVRCKDCRHFVREFDIVGHCDYCGIHLDHAESGFCSYGERRTDNDL